MLPLVGAVIGLIWWLASSLAGIIAPQPLAAAVIAAMPFLLTGFMHLDGFMDTSDAVLSWRPLEDRLRILKDSHTGAFAVVNLCVLMLFMYGASASVAGKDLRILVLIPVISRCGSAFCVTTLRPLGHSEYKGHAGNTAQRLAIIAVWLIATITGFVWLGRSAFVLLAETIAYALAMWSVVRILKGVSGDLAGFALTLSELAGLIVLCAV